MDELLKQALLYDFYGELLTDHQKEIYEQFILEDLSLGEIARDAGISRQGVHDLVPSAVTAHCRSMKRSFILFQDFSQ